MITPSVEDALAIWRAAVKAVLPEDLLRQALAESDSPLLNDVRNAERILIFGCGKAGASMSVALESLLVNELPRIEGIVNVPADNVRPLQRIRLHAARPAGSNHPTGARAVFMGNVGCLMQVSRHLKTIDPDLWVGHTIDALWASYSGELGS